MKRQCIASVLTSLVFALTGAACQKDSTAPSKQNSTAAKSKDDKPKSFGSSKPGASRPKSKPRPPVRPGNGLSAPTADDLAKFTEDLDGTGTLMVRFTTNHGAIHCELFEKGAPLTVANFVGLARGLHSFMDPNTGKIEKRPFFDGLIFHRVIPNFMIQGGDPMGIGSGGPGYKFAQEVSPKLKHDKPGILSMANAGPGTNGSQFFITEAPRPSLDGGYNVFGECMEIDVVGKIARVTKQGSKPVEPVVMEKVEIFRDDIKNYSKKAFK